MFAPNYHSAMKHVGPARKKMGKKTIFNLIGPLSSPAKVKRQVVGVFDKKWMKPFAEALRENNVVHAYIVHSDDGMDEMSPFAKTNVVELKYGKSECCCFYFAKNSLHMCLPRGKYIHCQNVPTKHLSF